MTFTITSDDVVAVSLGALAAVGYLVIFLLWVAFSNDRENKT